MLARCLRVAVLGLVLFALACDRGVAPFDPQETPSPPDLARIFPDREAQRAQAGASRSAEPAAAPSPATAEVVRGEIRILPALAEQVPDDALLFIIARTPGGGPPLAVKRIEAPELPLRFEIGPDDRMIAARPFAGPFSLSAWIDLDGNVMTRGAGDFEGSADGTVGPGAVGVNIVIDQAL